MHRMVHKMRSVQWRPSCEMYFNPCKELMKSKHANFSKSAKLIWLGTYLDSQYSLRIDRHGTSEQQHWSRSANLIAAMFEGKKKALFFSAFTSILLWFNWPNFSWFAKNMLKIYNFSTNAATTINNITTNDLIEFLAQIPPSHAPLHSILVRRRKKVAFIKKKRVTIVNGRKEVFVSMIKLAENNYYIMKWLLLFNLLRETKPGTIVCFLSSMTFHPMLKRPECQITHDDRRACERKNTTCMRHAKINHATCQRTCQNTTTLFIDVQT